MDRPDSNNRNRAKNWLYRFLKLKKRHSSEINNIGGVVDGSLDGEMAEMLRGRPAPIENNVSSAENLIVEAPPPSSMAKTRNGFRRSFKKMQTRVKGCVFRQNNKQKPIATTNSNNKLIENCSPSTSTIILDPLPRLPAPVAPAASSSSNDAPPPPLPERGHHSPAARHPVNEIINLSKSFWYWGPMSTSEAEEKLRLKPDGAFLVRDSSSTSYLFSLSFRSVGKTQHARIEYNRGKYNLFGSVTKGFPTITELIDDAIFTSENGIYCYSKKSSVDVEFPVRLTKPISRYTEVRSLKYLCKFVIRQYTNINDIPKLPLPTVLYSYLQEGPYF